MDRVRRGSTKHATRATAAPALGSPSTRTSEDDPSGRPVGSHDGFRHEAFLWEGEQEFLSGTVPFIRDGLRASQPVLVAVTQARIELLRAALGDDAHLVEFVDMAELGRNPARIIPALRASWSSTQPTVGRYVASASRSGPAGGRRK